MEIFKMKKNLKKLLNKGWKNAEIKYSEFRVYEKGDMGILYSTKTDRIIVKYHRSKK